MSDNIQNIIKKLYATRRDFWNIHPDSAEVLRKIIRKNKPKNILEIGTSNGMSAIIMGSLVAKYGGHITGIEFFEDRITAAKENIQEAGLESVVEAIQGDARDIVPQLEGPWDFVFIDAGKEDYIAYFNAIKTKLNPGAILVADNTISHRETLQDFIEAITNDNHFDVEELPVGEGLLVAHYVS